METSVEYSEIMYQRGKRDGLDGLNMSSTPAEYLKGYIEGHRILNERKLMLYYRGNYDG